MIRTIKVKVPQITIPINYQVNALELLVKLNSSTSKLEERFCKYFPITMTNVTGFLLLFILSMSIAAVLSAPTRHLETSRQKRSVDEANMQVDNLETIDTGKGKKTMETDYVKHETFHMGSEQEMGVQNKKSGVEPVIDQRVEPVTNQVNQSIEEDKAEKKLEENKSRSRRSPDSDSDSDSEWQ